MHCIGKKQIARLPAQNIFHSAADFTEEKINKNLRVIACKPTKAFFDFDSLVLSVSVRLAPGAAILACAAVKTQKGWSGFYKLFYISRDYKKTFKRQQDAFAKTDTDTLLPKNGAHAFKYRLTVLGKADIGFVCAALTKAGAKYNESLAIETLDVKDFALPLKHVSRAEVKNAPLRSRICSPAALTAVLNYWGKKKELKEVLGGVYDEGAGIFGAWPLNTAYSSQQGLAAAAVRCCSLAQAEGEVLRGRPLIVSVSYKKGGLKGAPVKETEGHLIVITGFDKEGNIITADSAAHALITYDRRQFAKVWLKNRKGIAYAIKD
jgi:hypothetical protein